MKQNQKHVLEIEQATTDPKIKLEARRIVNGCYRYIMEIKNLVIEAIAIEESNKGLARPEHTD